MDVGFGRLTRLARLALLLAMEVVLSRFLSIATPIAKIGFGFVPVVLAAVLYGPLWAGALGGLADFLGAILFPTGAYFPGFTLTAALVGCVYGWFLFDRPITWKNTLGAVSVISLVCHLGLNTLWLLVISGYGAMALLPTRAVQTAVMAVLQVLAIRLLAKVEIRK